MIVNRKNLDKAAKALASQGGWTVIHSISYHTHINGDAFIVLSGEPDVAFSVWDSSHLYEPLSAFLDKVVKNQAELKCQLAQKPPFFKPAMNDGRDVEWMATDNGFADKDAIEASRMTEDDFFSESVESEAEFVIEPPASPSPVAKSKRAK